MQNFKLTRKPQNIANKIFSTKIKLFKSQVKQGLNEQTTKGVKNREMEKDRK